MRTYKGIDCWKTWFIDECQRSHLFGVRYFNQIKQYRIGELIYLEDEPFFSKTTIQKHRICGPYRIVESTPEDPYEIKIEENGKIVIYKDLNASREPWSDNPAVTRFVKDGEVTIEVNYSQTAERFDFFPYRFSIESVQDKDNFVQHTSQCDLCNEE